MVSKGFDIASQLLTNLFLFFLVMGMASTVDIRDIKNQLKKKKAICVGLFCQFALLPFIGWAVVMIFNFPYPIGITLLVVVSSPGGSYSNWWCALMNADLALSVSMTTASTFLSLAFLPLNLFLYTWAAYGDDDGSILKSINFGGIFISLAIVIAAIAVGVFCSWKYDTPRWHRVAYLGGNISGICLILFTAVLAFIPSSGDQPTHEDLARGDTSVTYMGISIPCVLGLAISTFLSSLISLSKPERLTTAVECCYQNTGIATSAALSLFSTNDQLLTQAMRVPFIYGLVEIISIGLYLVIGWKLGWSKAPKNEKFCTVIKNSYEIRDAGDGEGENESEAGIEDGAVDDDEADTSQQDEEDKPSDRVRGHVDTNDTDTTLDTITNAESLEAEGGPNGQGIEMSLQVPR